MKEETEKEIRFIINRSEEQSAYIEKVKNSGLPYDRMTEIITSARGVQFNFQKRLDEMIETGLCDAFDAEKIANEIVKPKI